jgi:hypothetical protein
MLMTENATTAAAGNAKQVNPTLVPFNMSRLTHVRPVTVKTRSGSAVRMFTNALITRAAVSADDDAQPRDTFP